MTTIPTEKLSLCITQDLCHTLEQQRKLILPLAPQEEQVRSIYRHCSTWNIWVLWLRRCPWGCTSVPMMSAPCAEAEESFSPCWKPAHHHFKHEADETFLQTTNISCPCCKHCFDFCSAWAIPAVLRRSWPWQACSITQTSLQNPHREIWQECNC